MLIDVMTEEVERQRRMGQPVPEAIELDNLPPSGRIVSPSVIQRANDWRAPEVDLNQALPLYDSDIDDDATTVDYNDLHERFNRANDEAEMDVVEISEDEGYENEDIDLIIDTSDEEMDDEPNNNEIQLT